MYAHGIGLVLDDPAKLQRMAAVLYLVCRRGGLLISVRMSKTLSPKRYTSELGFPATGVASKWYKPAAIVQQMVTVSNLGFGRRGSLLRVRKGKYAYIACTNVILVGGICPGACRFDC